ncbi:MAG: RecX family transcriptional regulator [Alphaproteobacteria bacterium]|nr:RecX family transcriptional regulator [Alphaproteobacteria bacterium]
MSEARLVRRVRHHALRYLKSRLTTVGHLRTLLVRGARKRDPEVDPEALRTAVQSVLDELVAGGVLNDRLWAGSRVAALRRAGNSTRQIQSKLREKRLDAALIEELLDDTRPADDLRAALDYLRKRRLGPWAETPDPQRTLAKLGRRGFPYDIARRAVEMELCEARDITGR